jgi:NADH-quinone oxidoreductase subunit N
MHYALTFTVVLFSVAGIPPLAGFFSKLFVLLTAISSQYFLTSVFFIILSASACFFYIRLIKIFFFGNVVKNTFWLSQASKQNTETLIGLFLFFNFFLFLKLDSFMFLATILSFCLF